MRRVIYPLRVRELIVIPMNDQGEDDAGLWLALYDDEPGWLAHAFKRANPEYRQTRREPGRQLLN